MYVCMYTAMNKTLVYVCMYVKLSGVEDILDGCTLTLTVCMYPIKNVAF